LGALAGTGLLAGCRGSGHPAARGLDLPLPLRGGDLSFLPQEEQAGAVFKDGGKALPAERILARHGATHVRLRLWVHPVDGVNGLASVLAMGRRVHQAGMRIFLSLHYSDTWADSQTQTAPAAWNGQGPDELARSVETYTRDVIGAFAAQGTPLAFVQLGNEIDNGMLWPLGRVRPSVDESWAAFLSLFRAALAGAAASLGAGPRTVLHLGAGTDSARSQMFLDRVSSAGLLPDVIGFSYYPFWNGSLAALAQNLTAVGARYRRDLLVAETAYPWTLANADGTPNVVVTAGNLPDASTCPPTPAGQAAYYERLRAVLQRVPGGRALGFVIWAPDWLAGVDVTPGTGDTYDNLTLFDHQRHGLPALRCLRPPGSA
jgi:arabinogalactan endo-1,4-beta-galactosidase